jgi:hypothetical protein
MKLDAKCRALERGYHGDRTRRGSGRILARSQRSA